MPTVEDFLVTHGWGGARRSPLAGDASSRRYERLAKGAERAILMIDPQDDIPRFCKMAEFLIDIGLSAPTLIARERGLLLLEDFGDAQFAREVARDPSREIPLYTRAVDVLCAIETTQPPGGLSVMSAEDMGNMILPVFDNYASAFGRETQGMDLIVSFSDALSAHLPTETVLILRDFHAENMIWLPDRDGVRQVGLLDFQDALIGPPVYDLVSMLQDARRDVSKACRDASMRHFLDASGRTADAVWPLFHLLGLQRNLRILGIFARLALEKGKPQYLNLIPRVWGHVLENLDAPVARKLKPLVLSEVPAPTTSRLQDLRTQCQTA